MTHDAMERRIRVEQQRLREAREFTERLHPRDRVGKFRHSPLAKAANAGTLLPTHRDARMSRPHSLSSRDELLTARNQARGFIRQQGPVGFAYEREVRNLHAINARLAGMDHEYKEKRGEPPAGEMPGQWSPGETSTRYEDAFTLGKKARGLHNPQPGVTAKLPRIKQPSVATLERWESQKGQVRATDGCWVEPDGTCPHGAKSWMIELGLI